MEIQSSLNTKENLKANSAENNKVSLMEIKAAAKKEFNASIIQSAIDVNSASSSPQSLVLKTALEGINDRLKQTMGEDNFTSIQDAYDSGLDVSAEATASRIVSLSTAFFGSYQEQHPELSLDEALTQFTDVIRGGIDTGFDEARDILKGLNALDDDIATTIDSTYDLVQEGLDAFITHYLAAQADAKNADVI